MAKRKSQSINNEEEVVKGSAELNRTLDDQKARLKNLEKFKKDYKLLFDNMLNALALYEIILDKEGKYFTLRGAS